jgi:molecular chaperone IbpA
MGGGPAATLRYRFSRRVLSHAYLRPHSAVPFDRWNDLFDAAFRADDSAAGYPPYNIEKTGDDTYRIMMAVAGFGENDVEITAQENLLVVSGNLGEPREGVTYLYRGIATRAFERRFSLADHVKVVGATLADGVLQVDLERELPEAMKPRRIAVESKPGSGTKMIEGKKVVEAKKAA